MPNVSIIIPCYNSGKYLPDALDSLQNYSGQYSYEIIITDDGSTDTDTLRLLKVLETKPHHKVIRQANAGPAAARNTGVKHAQSDYILFLDSDNKIRSNIFIDKGISFLEAHPEVGVFYGNPAFFGDIANNRIYNASPFSLQDMLGQNYIDMCSLVRRKVWAEVGGLDELRMLMGHEDWDFWLRIGRTHWKFHHINEVLFDYRVLSNSLVTQALGANSHNKMIHYVLMKHIDILPEYYHKLSAEYSTIKSIRNEEINSPLRTFIKSLLVKFGVKQRSI